MTLQQFFFSAIFFKLEAKLRGLQSCEAEVFFKGKVFCRSLLVVVLICRPNMSLNN